MTKIALILSLLCAAVTPASAADAPRPDPKGRWRVITQDNATTTSKCIGKEPNATPLCAVENMIACFTRRHNELCLIGRGLTEIDDYIVAGAIDHALRTRYQIVVARPMSEDDVALVYRESGSRHRKVRPGDLYVIAFESACWSMSQGDRCEIGGTRRRFIVRKNPSGWAVVKWYGEPRRDGY